MDELGRLEKASFIQSPKTPLIVVLDNMRSMHNVGSFFRTADAFRIHKLLLCGYTAVPPHREIQKTALGATETVAWEHFSNTIDAIKHLKSIGYCCIAAEQSWHATTLPQLPIEMKPYALILGNEVEGVNQEVIELCDFVVEIPQFGTKHSLNVSIAGGILMYAFSEPWFGTLATQEYE